MKNFRVKLVRNLPLVNLGRGGDILLMWMSGTSIVRLEGAWDLVRIVSDD
jgi:hypothetical protein